MRSDAQVSPDSLGRGREERGTHALVVELLDLLAQLVVNLFELVDVNLQRLARVASLLDLPVTLVDLALVDCAGGPKEGRQQGERGGARRQEGGTHRRC